MGLQEELEERLDHLEAVVARGALRKIGRVFNEALHPRGRDGQFINKGGSVSGTFTDDTGGKVEVQRAKVTGFSENPSDKSDPLVNVELPDGTKAQGKASSVRKAASEKARSTYQEGATPKKLVEPTTRTITPEEIAAAQAQSGDAVETDDVEEALQLLADGKKVKLLSEDKVTILLDRMLEMYNDAEAKGEDAPIYNLCNVTVEGTSLFCTESKGINRIEMPQLKGKPLPGTPAADLERDERGEVDVTDGFRAYLEAKGVAIKDKDVQASHLKASQNELDGSKTASIGKAIENGTYDEARLFVSRDNYIVDGHHRWSGMLGYDLADGHAGDLYMPVAEIDMDIIDLLAEANAFAKEQGIPQSKLGGGPDSKPPVSDFDLDFEVATRTIDTGGSTTRTVQKGDRPAGFLTTGKSVSRNPERSRQFSEWPEGTALTAAIDKYVADNDDLLSQDGYDLGTWFDPDTGELWFDVVTVVNTAEEADRLARKNNQIAYFDLDTGETVSTGGTGLSPPAAAA